jgi:hypothetical protein
MDTNIEYWANDPDGEKPKYVGTTCPNATFSTINPTRTALETNKYIRG